MLSDLIPNISRHFLYSVLKSDNENGIEIIDTVTKLPPDQVGEFLGLLAGYLDGYFHALDAELEGYHDIQVDALTTLKNHEGDMEEFN